MTTAENDAEPEAFESAVIGTIVAALLVIGLAAVLALEASAPWAYVGGVVGGLAAFGWGWHLLRADEIQETIRELQDV